MHGEIFLLTDDDDLVEMKETLYDSEELLQKLLADHPKLLAGNQINPDDPRRWLLIGREIGVPDAVNGNNRWSLDHLFIDQDGVPTLVEVKRSSNTEIRRQVVAQLLEYAANSVLYWEIDNIIGVFKATCQTRGTDPDAVLQHHIGCEGDASEFWERVQSNMMQGNIRLMIVADEIPRELQRIIEYLNEQMNSAEVLGVEIKQYLGRNRKTMVSRVIGQTMRAVSAKTQTRTTKQWNRELFIEELATNNKKIEADVLSSIIAWAEDRELHITYGQGHKEGTVRIGLRRKEPYCEPFTFDTKGRITIEQWRLKKFPAFEDDVLCRSLCSRLNQILGEQKIFFEKSSESFAMNELRDQNRLQEFIGLYDWISEQILE
jgi:hypothetical protein